MLASLMSNPAGPQWWPDDMYRAVAVTIPPEDRKLVASAVTDGKLYVAATGKPYPVAIVVIRSRGDCEGSSVCVELENAIQVIDNTRTFAGRALQFRADAFGPELAPLEHQ